MRRFFDRPDTQWRQPSQCLHFYALPPIPSQLRDAFCVASEALAPVSGLGRLPERYLHITLQRLNSYADDLTDPRWGSVFEALGSALRAIPPFTVTFAAPTANSHAVEAIGGLSLDWSALISTIRRTLADHGLRDALTASPYAPHYTISYCVEDTPDAQIASRLHPVAQASSMQLSTVSLVAVDQDREAGVFRFETIREWPLGH